jgi:hypothetical protein
VNKLEREQLQAEVKYLESCLDLGLDTGLLNKVRELIAELKRKLEEK